jgi:hypothetical protein
MAVGRVSPALLNFCLVLSVWLTIQPVFSAQNCGCPLTNPTSSFYVCKQLSFREIRGVVLKTKSNHDEIMAPKSVKVMASILVIRSTEIAMLLTLLAGDVSSNPVLSLTLTLKPISILLSRKV